MNKLTTGSTLAAIGMAASGAAHAQVHAAALVQSVPVDSPWALASLAVVLAVVVARVLKKR